MNLFMILYFKHSQSGKNIICRNIPGEYLFKSNLQTVDFHIAKILSYGKQAFGMIF